MVATITPIRVWVKTTSPVFPKEEVIGVPDQPRYQQIDISAETTHNHLQQILSPNPNDEGVWIYQDAWFHKGSFDKGFSVDYTLKKPGNGIYLFIIKGDVDVDGQVLNTRDGYGIWDTGKITIKAITDAEILVMEVPIIVKQ